MAAVRRLGRVLRIHIQILQQHGLRERRLVVYARAAVAVAACANLEVERTVHPIGGAFVWLISRTRW